MCIRDSSNNNGLSPLNIAIILGRTKIAELLITNGAGKNTKNIDGNTSLDLAKKWRQIKIVEILLKHGAKTTQELTEGV